MINLQTDHPQVYQHFSNGGFSGQLADDNPFGRMPVDQATEVTVDKDTQTLSGTTKYCQKSGAARRYYLTAEHCSAFLGQLRDMTQVNQSAFHHSELQKPRIDRDDRAVAAVVELLDNWTNSYEGSQHIVILSSDNVAPKDVTHDDLSRAHSTGVDAYDSFKHEWLEEASRKKQFHDPMRNTRLNTFTTIERKKHVHISGNAAILKADRSLFGRMIVIAQSRKLHMRALATPECVPKKTQQSCTSPPLTEGCSTCRMHSRQVCNIVIDGIRMTAYLER